MARHSIFSRLSSAGKRTCLGRLAQLAVESLNGIGGVDQPIHLLGVLEIDAEIGQVGSPELGDFWVFLVPVLPQKGNRCHRPVEQ